ncbi:MAG: TetR/AcrR family transcriptional regulator [Mogibacterium sp.]|nr:TetR/AcrR family transcriptional regulator [Mogibacterium sp.]
MPQTIDRDKVRMDILCAFEKCMEIEPMSMVSLRDIAKVAGMSHANLLNYFDNKEDLIISYVRYARDFVADKCRRWFASHDRSDYDSNLSYMNDLLSYVAEGKLGETRPIATIQTYAIANYNPKISAIIREEFDEWHHVMAEYLTQVYGPEVGSKEAEAMMILIAGTFICNYTGALTGDINHNIIGTLGTLTRS